MEDEGEAMDKKKQRREWVSCFASNSTEKGDAANFELT